MPRRARRSTSQLGMGDALFGTRLGETTDMLLGGGSDPRYPVCGTDRNSTTGKPFRGLRGLGWHVVSSALTRDRRHREWVQGCLPGQPVVSSNIAALAEALVPFIEEMQPSLLTRVDDVDDELRIKTDIALAAATVERKLWAFVRDRLVGEFGDAEEAWWVRGFSSRIRKKCNDRREECERREHAYCYTDLVDFRDVLDKQWRLFQDAFAALLPHYRNKRELLSDLLRFNQLRRLVHGSRHSQATKDDMEFVSAFVSAITDLTAIEP